MNNKVEEKGYVVNEYHSLIVYKGNCDNKYDWIKITVENFLKHRKQYKLDKKLNKTDYLINSVVEKPNIKDAPSNKAVIGRYILSKKIFSKLKNLKPSKGGEIHITDAIQLLINDNKKFIAHNFTGKYLDCGSMDGYIKSTFEISKL